MARTLYLPLAAVALLAGATTQAAAKPSATPDSPTLVETVEHLRGLATWQLRDRLGAESQASLARAAQVIGALVTGRPERAIGAALADPASPLDRLPVEGTLSSPFGQRRDPIRRRRSQRHKGVDVVAKRGTPVHAAGAGLVTLARRNGGYGRVVYVDHGDGLQTRYAHLNKILVEPGDFVVAGTELGQVGTTGRSTGPHLHFEVRVHGQPVSPRESLGMVAPAPAPLQVVRRLGELVDELVGRDDAKRAKGAKRRGKKPARDRARTPRSKRPTS